MRLTQIQQILEIEKCTSISQAARNLYISQPALSALLNEFESEIGVQLFTRTKNGVKPTENGTYILESMKKIMHEVDYIQTYTANADELSGNFTLMVGSSYEFLYPELIRRFKCLFPKANLIPDYVFSQRVADKVSKGILDMALLALYNEQGGMLPSSYFDHYKNLKILRLKNCHTFAILHPSHEKSGQEFILLSDLIAEQLIFGKQFEIEVFRENLPLKKYPLFNIDRVTVLKLLAQNTAIYLDASPLSLLQYKTEYQTEYQDYCVLPVINDCMDRVPDINLEFPIYLIFRKSQNSRLQQLYIDDTIQLLRKYDLFF